MEGSVWPRDNCSGAVHFSKEKETGWKFVFITFYITKWEELASESGAVWSERWIKCTTCKTREFTELWASLIRRRVTGKLTSVCISDCGVRSGFTVLEEQEKMLFFTLLSVFWTNIDWGNPYFFPFFVSSSIPNVLCWCTSINRIHILRNTFSFLITRVPFSGRL